MMKANDDLIRAVMRKRGELNITNKQLAKITGVSQWTLTALFHGRREFINQSTNDKLSKWLYAQV